MSTTNIAELPVTELVTMTERADDLPLLTVRQLLGMEPQVAGAGATAPP